MELGPRLKAVADFVPPGSIMADIGTDHAYLPVYLVEKGIVPKAIASDNKEGPCEAARKTVATHGLTKNIEVRIGDGLATISAGEITAFAIAGMGGLTMLSILEAAPHILESSELNAMVLQPQTDSDAVRQWAEKHGWGIVAEELVEEGNKLYEIMRLVRKPGYKYSGKSYEIGHELVRTKHPLLQKKLLKMMKAYTTSLEGMERSAKGTSNPEYIRIKNKLKKLKEIYDENYSC